MIHIKGVKKLLIAVEISCIKLGVWTYAIGNRGADVSGHLKVERMIILCMFNICNVLV